MPYLVQSVCDLARLTLQDAVKTRHSDPNLLTYYNACMQTLAAVRLDLFVQNIELATVPDKVEQDIRLANANHIALYNIYGIKGGKAVTECALEPLARHVPNWRSDPAGNPVHWMRHPDDPLKRDANKYFLWVRPKAGIILNAQVATAPEDAAIGDPVPISVAYRDALAHYIVYKAEAMDDESVLTARAQASLAFAEKVFGVTLQTKVVIKEGKPA